MERTSILESAPFAVNPGPRCHCVLLLDISGSMQGEPIDRLNDGIRLFKEEVSKDEVASKRVEIALVTFDSDVEVVCDFTTADAFEPFELTAKAQTYTGTAVLAALDLLEARKALYRRVGVLYYRPWVFLITDGEPQGEPSDFYQMAAKRIREDEAADKVVFFAVGVEGANMQKLADLVVRAPLKLNGLNFRAMFLWLSNSMGQVSRSRIDDQVALPPPGWGTV